MNIRSIAAVITAKEAIEGAGVRLHRGFAQGEVPRFDPFLLFDDFSSDTPADYLAGFPWHPHRGIETVTYVLAGDVRHRDSIGNAGVIGAGDLQWMTAGGGIIHEEMPEGTRGIHGFQLWVNLPARDKMIQPRYQDIRASEIPEIPLSPRARAKVVAGEVGGVRGPIEGISAAPRYLDLSLDAESEVVVPVPDGHTAFLYVIDGALASGDDDVVRHGKGTIILFSGSGESVRVRAGSSGARYLLVSGRPIGEPVAWYGPIVMNTEEELQAARRELSDGTFLRGHA